MDYDINAIIDVQKGYMYTSTQNSHLLLFANQIDKQTVRSHFDQYREQLRTYTIITNGDFRLRRHKHETGIELQHETSFQDFVKIDVPLISL